MGNLIYTKKKKNPVALDGSKVQHSDKTDGTHEFWLLSVVIIHVSFNQSITPA